MPCHRRGPWSNLEDKYLMQLVHAHGPLNWVRIAQTLGSRTAKQCRERYHQNLKPTLDHEPITPEEGLQIERLVHEIGKRWAEIARRLHGRSDNAVKNWWNGSQNRRKRLDRRRAVTPIELPPLRTWQASRSRGARLPSPSSLAPQNGQPGSQPRPPLAGALGQLPTAPNSPVRSQEQQQQAGSGSEDATRDRDSRMRLATLLG
ncbi:myb-like DNA-binding domain-containing protein [Hirsutella rhossiliensis]|uniref:Myb-like DNA-binding domain-containing protein n=1 Tax=Hirsutella rhossiliensis TaxID=111463 RepID=A0A9P8MSG6_9HYPO|nr:myb-like DNA-binding domain-containing protein [Hirsutella rhossiliensis]KAH0960390.1 myb-like DNA-binding domain-containing protein [Hirsutella rhossiliensis]